jgi:hypothetical protein
MRLLSSFTLKNLTKYRATVIDKVYLEAQKTGRPVLYYFFDHSFRGHLTACALFESYTKQLVYHLESTRKGCPPVVIDRIVDFYGPDRRPPSLEEVVDELIIPLLAITGQSTFIVDGLDECSAVEAREVLAVFKRLITLSSIRAFIACREDIDVIRVIQGSVRLRITPENNKEDMELFIEHQLETMQSYRRICDNGDMLANIKEELLKRADRMYVALIPVGFLTKYIAVGFFGLNFKLNFYGTAAVERMRSMKQFFSHSANCQNSSTIYTEPVC